MKTVTEYSNPFEIRKSSPLVTYARDVIYMPIQDAKPWEHDSTWGIYDQDGSLIDRAAYYRGSGLKLVGQSVKSDITMDQVEVAPPGNYLYGGNLIAHYGHFLISTLSRFWLRTEESLRNYKIVCHGAGQPNGWFSHRAVQEVFEALGLREDQFVVFKRPTLIRRLFIPEPCSQEHNFAHAVFADLGHLIGDKLSRHEEVLFNTSRPVYLSKTRLRHGVQRFINEQDLCDFLEREGVEICYPEEMTIASQLQLFRKRSAVLACLGSSLHTSILCKPSAKLVSFTHAERINSNYGLIDMVNNNNITYVHEHCPVVERVHSNFNVELKIPSPRAVADEMLRQVNRMND